MSQWLAKVMLTCENQHILFELVKSMQSAISPSGKNQLGMTFLP